MRVGMIAATLPLLALAACGGGAGPESVGSIAAPAPTGGTGTGGTGTGGSGTGVTPTPSATPAPTPTPTSGGSGSGIGTTPTPTPTPTPTTFLNVTSETQFAALGAVHSLAVNPETGGELYGGNASTVRAPTGRITYNPRDGIFTINFADDAAGVTRDLRFQDPAHRSDYNPERTPMLEVPNLDGFNYLESVDGEGLTSFFYQRPGATAYVTLAGFAHTEDDPYKVEHGVMVFGSLTPQLAIPMSGTASYTGGFIASAVLNNFDKASPQATYFQWFTGSSAINVDFGRSTVGVSFDGVAAAAFYRGQLISPSSMTFPSGTRFQAAANATINLVRTGGFSGAFTSATLGGQAINFAGISQGSNVAGASSIDGAFYGPNAQNVGGNFRIVGGVPDQRVDIQGAFTGAVRR